MPDDPLRLIGTQAFLPALLSHIRVSGSPVSLPVDQVIFQSILLCLIAGDKYLILRTPEEDVGLTVKLVAWTLSSIFNLSTHKLKLRPSTRQRSDSTRHHRASTPTASNGHGDANTQNGPVSDMDPTQSFLRSLFLPSSSSNSNQALQDEGGMADSFTTRPHSSHSNAHHRQGSTSRPGKQKANHPRSRSYPNNLAAAAHAHGERPDTHSDLLMHAEESITPTPTPTTSSTSASGTSTILGSILKPQPMYGYNPQHHLQMHAPTPHLPHAYTDPFPLPVRRKKRSLSRSQSNLFEKTPKDLPHALVLSGLEDASEAVQRALAEVFRERKVVLDGYGPDKEDREHTAEEGIWVFPEDFIAVYVCPWNARERPRIHKTLLDKFAMSTNVFVSQNIRSDFQLLPFSLSFSSSSLAESAARPALRPFPTPSQSGLGSRSNPGSPMPRHTPLPPTHTPPVYTRALPGQGVQGHYQQQNVHSYQQHQHHQHQRGTPPTSSVPLPNSPSSSKAHQSHIPTDLLPATLLATLRDAYNHTNITPSLDLYLSDLLSAARHDSRLDGTLLGLRCVRDAHALVRASRVIGCDLTGAEIVRDIIGWGEEGSGDENEQDQEDEDSWRQVDADGVTSDEENTTPKSKPKSRQILDVSEVDIARIVPRVISHRVRLRDGPEDEVLASALFGATFGSTSAWANVHLKKPSDGSTELEEDLKAEDKEFDSVKSVLVNILSEV